MHYSMQRAIAEQRSQVRCGHTTNAKLKLSRGEGAELGGASSAEALTTSSQECRSYPATDGDTAFASGATQEAGGTQTASNAVPTGGKSYYTKKAKITQEDRIKLEAAADGLDEDDDVARKLRAATRVAHLDNIERQIENELGDFNEFLQEHKSEPTAGSTGGVRSEPTAGSDGQGLPLQQGGPTAGTLPQLYDDKPVTYRFPPTVQYGQYLAHAVEMSEVTHGNDAHDGVLLAAVLSNMLDEPTPEAVLRVIRRELEFAARLGYDHLENGATFEYTMSKRGQCGLLRVLLLPESPVYGIRDNVHNYILQQGGKSTNVTWNQMGIGKGKGKKKGGSTGRAYWRQTNWYQ